MSKLPEIRSFLAHNHPFEQLSEKALSELPEKLQIRYFRRGSEIPDTGTLFDHLYLIRTGKVELNTPDGELQTRLGEGDMFGYRSSHVGSRDKLKAFAMEDILVYQLRAADLWTGFAMKIPSSTVSSTPPMKCKVDGSVKP